MPEIFLNQARPKMLQDKNKKGTVLNSILLFLTVVFIGVVISRFITRVYYWVPLIVISGFIVCIISFIKTDWALIILIFSMLLSPEIEVANLPARAVTIRLEDFFIIFMFFGWLAKMAINKQMGFFRKTSINLPVSLYVLILIISTLKGIMFETVSPIASFFFLLKYIEYIMIFFLFANNLKSLKQIKTLVFFSLLVYVVVNINAFRQMIVSGFAERAVCAPFDSEGHPEPNTLAGYLLLFMGIIAGLLLYSDSTKRRLLLLGIFSLAILPFLWTFSRGGWLGFISMYLVLLLLSKRMKITLFILLILGILFLPRILPKQVTSRIEWTFKLGEEREILGRRVVFDTSSTARIDAWGRIITKFFLNYPLLGAGVTGIGLADSQYFRVLGEIGLIGFLIFTWLMVSIFRVAFKNLKTIDDPWVKGLSLGFLAGFSGLLIHGITANVFIIVRIMEPFMFMTAVMTALNELFSPGISPQEIT